MKKILAVAIVLVMLSALVACEASKGDLTSINDYVAPNYTYTTKTGTFTFAEAGGNTAIITGYVGKAEAHEVEIPETVTLASAEEESTEEETTEANTTEENTSSEKDDNIRVIVGIGDRAFYYCTAMTAVVIPDTVVSIGDWAFAGCTGLTNVELPAEVTTIGEGAFHGCNALTNIKLSENLVKIGAYAFYECKGLEKIEFPATLTEIGSGAFFGCQGLTALDIPAATTIIGDLAFYQCNHLESIKINTTAENIEFGEYIFWSELKDKITAPADSKAAEYVNSIVISGVGEEVTTQGEETTEAAQ